MIEKRSADILQKIEKVFQEQFLWDDLKITPETSPEQVEEWDSLAHINLIAALEKDFGVHFSAEEIGEIVDVRGIVEAISKKL